MEHLSDLLASLIIRLGLEKLARDKHSSLLRKSVNYGQQKLDKIDTWKAVSTSPGAENFLSIISLNSV